MGTKFEDYLREKLKDPEYRKEYEAMQPEYEVRMAILRARLENGLTQEALAQRTGIAQGDISKLENGNFNPSVKILQRLAAGMGMNLRIEFVPAKQ